VKAETFSYYVLLIIFYVLNMF